MGAGRVSPSASLPISRTKKGLSGGAPRRLKANGGRCAMPDNPPATTLGVLIVDNDRQCAATFAEHLQRHGFQTAVATSEEMFAVLKTFNASIVLCDIEGEGA